MASGLAPSTVAMSVRNALVRMTGPRSPDEVIAHLKENWPVRGLEDAEVKAAIEALGDRGLVEELPLGLVMATDGRLFVKRAREDGDGWEGWS